ncbi:T9SS type A sorting domain-containing protein [Hymenobacter saemangeumensis]|uniref:T9SS type A sorting domain-containing protein n=1 Tax=Hymenobacter saemangeumensis TaxID=1084522 RepID=UPI0031EDD908
MRTVQFGCSPASNTICQELDLDGDGSNDVSLAHAQVSTGGLSGVVYYEVRALRTNVELAGADSATWNGSRNSYALPLALGEDIDTPARAVGRFTSWRQGTATAPAKVTIFFSQSAGPGQPGRVSGYWLDSNALYYAGARIGTAQNGYRYGWMLVRGQAWVESYAMQTVLTGSSQARALALSLYPNPALQEVVLTLPTASSGQATLRDLSGRAISQQELNSRSATHSISLEQLPAGVYLLEVHTPAGSATRRILKK